MVGNIGSAEASDLKTADPDFSVAPQDTDGTEGTKETEWMNKNYEQWLGYYKTIPELKAVIDKKAEHIVGKGFKANKQTKEILERVTGFGEDTFNDILENMYIVSEIGGDSYAEIITTDGKLINEDGSNLLNLKPLDPAVMKHIANSKGKLTRFEQTNKLKPKQTIQRFKPKEIFYIARDRVADEIHGTSMTEKLATIILMKNEAMADVKTLMHRHIKPFNIFYLNTDDATKIAAFKRIKDAANPDAENMYVAMGAVKVEQFALPAGAAKSALDWIISLDAKFQLTSGVPKVLLGDTTGTTEAGSKMAIFAFMQTTEARQAAYIKQIERQLHLKIRLEKPASLEDNLKKDNTKDGREGTKPNDTTAKVSGNK